MIQRLVHDDAMTHLVSNDVLAISTGERLPFDVDGRWQVHLAHRA